MNPQEDSMKLEDRMNREKMMNLEEGRMSLEGWMNPQEDSMNQEKSTINDRGK